MFSPMFSKTTKATTFTGPRSNSRIRSSYFVSVRAASFLSQTLTNKSSSHAAQNASAI